MVKKYSKSEGADLGIHDFGYLCEGQLRDTRACVDLSSSCYWKICPSHMCLASRIMSLNCHGCEKDLGFFFCPWWAPVLGLIYLFLFSSFLRWTLTGAVWEAVGFLLNDSSVCSFLFVTGEALRSSWSAVELHFLHKNQKMGLDFYGPWHLVTKCRVRLVCLCLIHVQLSLLRHFSSLSQKGSPHRDDGQEIFQVRRRRPGNTRFRVLMWGAVEGYKGLCGLVLIMLLENLPFTHISGGLSPLQQLFDMSCTAA